MEIFVRDEGEGIMNPTNLFVPFFTTKPGGFWNWSGPFATNRGSARRKLNPGESRGRARGRSVIALCRDNCSLRPSPAAAGQRGYRRSKIGTAFSPQANPGTPSGPSVVNYKPLITSRL